MIDRTDRLWYKNAVIYELHVKAFFDANNDGIGDFAGLVRKLDYLQELGITAIWLLPFYPSPRRDDGYDISDYRGVHPDYGKLSDARRFIAEAHRRDLRVITELVINHTSDQHPWFIRARAAKAGSAARNSAGSRLPGAARNRRYRGARRARPRFAAAPVQAASGARRDPRRGFSRCGDRKDDGAG